jgi:MSHA biogenesis protein MshO
MRTLKTKRYRSSGFTLIEMVMVIVIMGVIGGIVAVFMKSPIDAYFDSARRAALTDVADTAVRRMARDIRKALPNSVLNPNNQCLEFIPTKTGGRYRAEELVAGDDSSLNFAAADATFNMFGRNSALPADQRIVAGDVIAVYNLGIPGADAYLQNNTAVVAVAPTEAGVPVETTIAIASTLFPLASGGNRFHVIPNGENVLAFVCDGVGNLRRTARAFAGAPCPATGAILARNVGACNFVYNDSDLQRNALVQLGLTFTDSGESVNLYHEVHVDNTP